MHIGYTIGVGGQAPKDLRECKMKYENEIKTIKALGLNVDGKFIEVTDYNELNRLYDEYDRKGHDVVMVMEETTDKA